MQIQRYSFDQLSKHDIEMREMYFYTTFRRHNKGTILEEQFTIGFSL